jgi:PAS domain S-box-containing protein
MPDIVIGRRQTSISPMLAKHLFETSLDLIMVTDRRGQFIEISPSSMTILGYRPDEMTSLTGARFIYPDDLDRTRNEMRQARRGQQTRNFECRYVHKNGSIVTLAWNGVWSENEQLHFFIGRDTTAAKLMERLKDEFVATMSHELRTPLTSIAAALGLLAGGTLPAPTMRLLKIAQANSQRLVRLVNGVLDLEKIESGKVVFVLKRIEVHSLVEQAIDANRGFADSFDVRIRLNEASATGDIRGDPDWLLQVTTNLLSNAVKFSPPGEEVVVAIENRGGRVHVSVRDHGHGVPEDFKPRIFERFAQADATDARKRGGTGLGLSIVKQIVTRLGGEVGFADAPGGGAIFHVEFPGWEQEIATVSEREAKPAALVPRENELPAKTNETLVQ